MPTEKRASLPQGLGSNKKSRSNVDLIEELKKEQQQVEADKPNVYFELEHDADRFDELQAMFDGAEASLDDPKKAVPLLRGVVHECNSLQHGEQQDGEEPQEEEEQNPLLAPISFPARFFRIFAEALMHLAILENPITTEDDTEREGDDKEESEDKVVDKAKVQERMDFLQAAKRKVDEGLEEHGEDGELLALRAHIVCALAANGDEFAALQLRDFASAFVEQLQSQAMLSDGEQTGAALAFLSRLHDCKEEAVDAKCAKRIVEVLLSIYEDVVGDEDDSEDDGDEKMAAESLVLKLALMNSLASAQLELGETAEVDKFLARSIEAGESFVASTQQLGEEMRGELVCKLGESHMLLGSAKALADDVDGELAHSQRAVAQFEEAKALGVELDSAIEEFIEDVRSSSALPHPEEPTVDDFTVITATQ